jgi:hypothetical protein
MQKGTITVLYAAMAMLKLRFAAMGLGEKEEGVGSVGTIILFQLHR